MSHRPTFTVTEIQYQIEFDTECKMIRIRELCHGDKTPSGRPFMERAITTQIASIRDPICALSIASYFQDGALLRQDMEVESAGFKDFIGATRFLEDSHMEMKDWIDTTPLAELQLLVMKAIKSWLKLANLTYAHNKMLSDQLETDIRFLADNAASQFNRCLWKPQGTRTRVSFHQTIVRH